jgi:hypothetical protein
MSELRETIAKIVKQAILVNAWSDENCRKWADEILNLPQIAEGQYLYSRKKVKAGKPSREPDLGHSIGTRR